LDVNEVRLVVSFRPTHLSVESGEALIFFNDRIAASFFAADKKSIARAAKQFSKRLDRNIP
jgi:hypothetical protein